MLLRDYYETYIQKRLANDNHDEQENDVEEEEEEIANDSGFRESTPIVEESSRYVGYGT